MRRQTYSRARVVTIFCAAGVALLFAAEACAHPRDFLNGTWVVQPVQTEHSGEPVTLTGTVTIDDVDGEITVSRNFTYTGHETFYFRDRVEAAKSTIRGDGETVRMRDGDALMVFTTRDGVQTVDNYSLAPDGTMIDVAESAGNTPLMVVLHRQ